MDEKFRFTNQQSKMKRLITLFAILMAAFKLCAAEFEGTVVKVSDGDTIWVMKPGHEVESDVTDFDAPDTPGQVKTSCQFAQLPPTFYKKWASFHGVGASMYERNV